MKAINLNYASSRYRDAASYAWLVGSILCLLILICFYLQLATQVSAIDASIERIKSPQQNYHARLTAHKVNSDEMIEVQRAMRELAVPWESLFATLEALNRSGVRLLAVEPEVKQHQLKLTAEAHDIKQMLDYVSALASQAKPQQPNKNASQSVILDNVLLVSQTQATGVSGQPILNFVVEAKWVF